MRPTAPVGRTAPPPSAINNSERNWAQPTSRLGHNRRSMSVDLSTVTPTFQKEDLPVSTSEGAPLADLPKTTSTDRLVKPPVRKSSAQTPIPPPPERKVPVQIVTPPARQDSGNSIDEDMLLALQYVSPELVPPTKQVPPKPVEDSSSSSESESDDPPPIKPTPIQQRAPPPSFAVTSRPAHRNQNSVVSNAESMISSSTILTRRRSVSMAAKPTRASTTSNLISQIPDSKVSDRPDPKPPSASVPPIARPGTLMANHGSSSSSSLATSNNSQPQKPFLSAKLRRDSPASSTGDDSSGRLPLTPRDGSEFGSDYGVPPRKPYSKERRSVSFDDVQKVGLKQRIDEEEIRKARR